jgi:hypothetical protein
MGDLGAELDLFVEFVLAGGVAEVVPDLGLGGIVARPVVVGFEREGVVVGLDITGTSGVGVGPPGALYIWLKLEDGECRDIELCLDPNCRA